ncbi:glycolate oxidase subunit GlcE [Paraburkholderia sp. 40]|uniref:glycolate oxidase subunit GlcE n=1 Tax=Paraburkholderia sp. 40 TaxID=2991059 RepID=UPI003D19CCF3
MRRDMNPDNSAQLIEQVMQAISTRTPLRIRGGDSKLALGRVVDAEPLDTRKHRDIISYDPTELVVTARAGTPVAELNAVLDAAGQMLPCEPPAFGGAATVGGMVASGLSGPRRPWAGSVRDFVLGCRAITGNGKHLRFGGEVMKNVAGYDVSRLLTGSYGCLGLITEVSLKVLPKPRATVHLELETDVANALSRLAEWRRSGLPIAGACYTSNMLHLRIEGGNGSVRAARELIGGEEADDTFWTALREFRLPFFDGRDPLWRISLPPTAPVIDLPGDTLLDWGGAQRWLTTSAPADELRQIAQSHGGHATAFRSHETNEPFHPLPAPLLRYHRQLKQRLDPHGIFNPGRIYAEI